MGNALFCDISLISGVIDDHSACLIGVIHPLLKPVLRDGGSAGIVWKTQVDKVRRLFRKFRKETIFFQAGHIDYPVEVLHVSVIFAGASRHNVGIHIYRIYRVADSYFIVNAENLLDISGIAFGPVGHKDLVSGDIAASVGIVVFRDSGSQELITEIRGVSVKSLPVRHLVDGFMKSVDHCRRQRLGHVADSETHDLILWMRLLISGHFLRYIGKKIASR